MRISDWSSDVCSSDLLIRAGNDAGGEGAGAAAPPTVYRALDFLLANGFIHKLESVNAFVACHHPSTAQHSVPFLICDRCHSATELEDLDVVAQLEARSEEHTSELQSLMRISYAVFCLKKKKQK